MQFSGSSAASVCAKASGSNFPRAICGFTPLSTIGTRFGALSSSASQSSAATASCSGRASTCVDADGRRHQTRLAGIREERGRRFRADEDHVSHAREYLERAVHHVGNAIDRNAAAAARHARYLRRRAQLRTARLGDAMRGDQSRLRQVRRPTERASQARDCAARGRSIAAFRERPRWAPAPAMGCATSPPSFHAVSAGRISVAI